MNIKRIIFLGLVFCITHQFYAQDSVNDYKYIIVPEGYVFLRENDDYQLNSLSKFLFQKYGFTAFIRGEELPEDLKINGCKGLRADVKKKSGLLKTKLSVDLIDCNGTVVFSSKEGVSREKDFKKSYHEALRNAFKYVKALNYKYNGKKDLPVQTKDVVAQQPLTVNTPIEASKVEATAATTEGVVRAVSQGTTNVLPKATNSVASVTYVYNEEIYIFEKRDYGFEIISNKTKPTSIGKVYTSSNKNSYIVKAGDLSGNGHFDAYRNFILERINPVTDKVITDTFARQ